MKNPKNISRIFILLIFFFLASCQSRVVSLDKPMDDNVLELYQKYTIRTKDPETQKIEVQKIEVLKVDSEKIYGKNKTGESVEIQRNKVYEIQKPSVLGSVIIAVLAVGGIATVIFTNI